MTAPLQNSNAHPTLIEMGAERGRMKKLISGPMSTNPRNRTTSEVSPRLSVNTKHKDTETINPALVNAAIYEHMKHAPNGAAAALCGQLTGDTLVRLSANQQQTFRDFSSTKGEFGTLVYRDFMERFLSVPNVVAILRRSMERCCITSGNIGKLTGPPRRGSLIASFPMPFTTFRVSLVRSVSGECRRNRTKRSFVFQEGDCLGL